MEKFKISNKVIPIALESVTDEFCNFKSFREKIFNAVKIHHYREDMSNFAVNTKTNSLTLTPQTSNQSHFSSKVLKTFLLDSISIHEMVFVDLLVSAIKRVVNYENSLIISVNRGTRKSSKLWNKEFLETLTTWLYHYLKLCEDREHSKFSIRISALEIDEENDELIDLTKASNEENHKENYVSLDSLTCRRCNDLNGAIAFFNEIKNTNIKEDKNRKHVLYTFQIYQQTSLKSESCSVFSKCSKIFLLNLDLTKCRSQHNPMSLPFLSKFITTLINKEHRRINCENKFQKVFAEIFQKNINFYSFITQISAKDKKFSDTYQLLQLSGRIQRLKIKLKKSWDFPDRESDESPKNTNSRLRKCNFHRSGKFSDSEITSNSEFSCAETVICARDERRRNSDDESMISWRLRSAFISSDSDSGCKDIRMSQSSYSRDGTPVNTMKKKSHPRTNAHAWPKSAIRMAKTTMLNGQELWVDGPTVFQKTDNDFQLPNQSVSTISTPETVKQVLGTSNKFNKAVKSQETQYEYQKLNPNDPKPDFHPLSDITEITDELELIKQSNEFMMLSDVSYNSLNSRISQNKLNLQNEQMNPAILSPKNDVRKVSRWIRDVNQLTATQVPLSKSFHEQFIPKQYSQQVLNSSSSNSHSYQYYDPDSQDDYSSYPRLYSPVQSNLPVTKNDSKQISYVNEDEQKNVSISDKKLFNRYKKKDSNINESKDNSKLRSFMSKSPLGILKKTLFQSKSSKKKTEIPEYLVEPNTNLSNSQEIRYLMPAMHLEDSSDSSSDSECNEWFRNIKTFKNKLDTSTNKYSTLRPPSAPLLAGSGSIMNSLHPTRQRSSSSGYGSVITKDSEISSHIDSNSDQSIHSFPKPSIKQSTSFTQTRTVGSAQNELDPDVIAQRCENLVKQEKALLLMQHQELMIQDFYTTTRPLLTNDDSKYTLRMSTVNYDRLLYDNQYLEELEEDTNIIRDSIAFYKSLIHLESSFLSSPERHRKHLN